MRFLEASELERLSATVPERHRALVLVAGYLGLRWGEACGLKRARLNLLKGSLEVSEILLEIKGALSFGEPKTKASRRRLSLPPFLVGELETHLEEHSTHPELIFAGRDGGPLRRNNFRRRTWLPAVERAGLTPLRFHDLRHTAAGLLIAQNVHPKIIQSRLGHSSIAVTLDRYGHLLPNLDGQVAEGLEATRRAALAENPAAHLLHDSRN
jgi:integrase